MTRLRFHLECAGSLAFTALLAFATLYVWGLVP